MYKSVDVDVITLDVNTHASLALPLRRAGEGEHVEESGDTAIQFVALSNDLSVPIRLLHTRGNNFV